MKSRVLIYEKANQGVQKREKVGINCLRALRFLRYLKANHSFVS
jgi:hypothetical protein